MSPCLETGVDSVESNGIWYRAPSTSYYWWWARPWRPGTKPDIGAVEGTWPDAIDDPIRAAFPGACELEQNYPNPFNPTTVVSYQLPVASEVHLVVYDMLGREVKVLVDGRKEPGTHKVLFDASGLSSGIYFYRLMAGTFVQTRSMVLVR